MEQEKKPTMEIEMALGAKLIAELLLAMYQKDKQHSVLPPLDHLNNFERDLQEWIRFVNLTKLSGAKEFDFPERFRAIIMTLGHAGLLLGLDK